MAFHDPGCFIASQSQERRKVEVDRVCFFFYVDGTCDEHEVKKAETQTARLGPLKFND